MASAAAHRPDLVSDLPNPSRPLLSPARFLDAALARHPGTTAIVDGARRLDYAAFATRVHRLVAALDSMDVRDGARVAYLGFNRLALLDLYHAVVRTGAVLVPLNVRLARADVAYILEDCRPRLIVVEPELAHLIEGAVAQVPRIVLGGPVDEYEDWLARHAPDAAARPVDEEDACAIFYTSGTTARPKGVVLSHRGVYLHALNARVGLDYREGDVQLHTIPLFHVNGWGTPHILPNLGGTQILLDRFDAQRVLAVLRSEPVTVIFLVPTMLVALLEALGDAPPPCPTLRHIFIGGAAMAESLARRAMERLDCVIRAGYGMTETGPVLTAGEWGRDPVRATRAGRAIPGVDLIVATPDAQPVLRDDIAIGEIMVRSDHVLSRYTNAPLGDLVQQGWLRTGDLATWDASGSVRIVDRAKDMIISGGENIASVEVEAALAAHPDVVEAAVIGCPDATWGERVVACVVLRLGSTLDAAALDAFLRTGLAAFKRPREFRFLAALPKGGTGKVQKKLLRESS